ncbi:helix-turn-helix domain-containing protein [Candidatus Methylomirabilis sp.]|uniref:helix-turn-helix domain-containing protein n=1 Tax=Candidatus Methylomirabilis sp. TaxID=2032687 RepID=UPI003C78417B
MSAELKTQIGKRLRRIRRMRDLTQKELANKIAGKVDYTYIGKIERGEQLPSLKVLGKLSDALAAPLAFFFQEEVLSHLLPEELRKLNGEAERTALLREVAKISRGDIPLLLEIIRVLTVHRRMTGGKRKATQYSIERKELQRAAERVGQYGIKRAGLPVGVLQEAIEKPERLIQKAKRSRP